MQFRTLLNHIDQMKTIDRHEAIDLLASVSRPMPIGLVTLTDARALRKAHIDACPVANPFAQVFKLSRVWPFIGADYGRAVNAQLTREGAPADFVPLPPSSRYTRISEALIRFPGTGNFAVPVQFNSQLTQAASPRFLVRDTRLSPLRMVAREVVAPFLPVSAPSARQAEAGIENPVIWRHYGIESILRLALAGEVYRIRAS